MDASRQRLIFLDLARFLAAMAVVIFHYKSRYIGTLPVDSELAGSIYSITKFGYLGVNLFFLISGYVIFASAMNRRPVQFLISRAIRIYPTFWACATISCLLITIYPGTAYTISLRDYLVNLTLLYNYFGIKAIDEVYWTLVVELKFYACIFLLALLGWLKYYRVWITLWLAATAGFVFFGQPFFLGWFISPEYSPYFIAGIIFYLAQREGYNRQYVSILVGALALALRHAYLVADEFTRYVSETDRIVVMAIVSVFFVVFYLLSKDWIHLKYRRIYLILGAMTYPLYLLHNAAGKFTFDYFVKYISPFPLLILITLAIMGLSYAINRWLEKKLLNRLKVYLFRKLDSVSKSLRSTLPARYRDK